jgi:hypothetical protein
MAYTRRLLTIHVPNFISIFQYLGHAKQSVQVWGSIGTFRKKLIFYGGGVVKTYPQAATCQLLRLLIQYICGYAPYLEAISSIHNLTDTQCHGGNGPTWSSSQYSDVVSENRVNKSSWICLSLTHQGVLVAIWSAEKALRTVPILPSLLLQ